MGLYIREILIEVTFLERTIEVNAVKDQEPCINLVSWIIFRIDFLIRTKQNDMSGYLELGTIYFSISPKPIFLKEWGYLY